MASGANVINVISYREPRQLAWHPSLQSLFYCIMLSKALGLGYPEFFPYCWRKSVWGLEIAHFSISLPPPPFSLLQATLRLFFAPNFIFSCLTSPPYITAFPPCRIGHQTEHSQTVIFRKRWNTGDLDNKALSAWSFNSFILISLDKETPTLCFWNKPFILYLFIL